MARNEIAADKAWRAWADLTWRRLILGAALSPLPALYIGFVAFFLAYSDRNLTSVYRLMIPTPPLYAWSFSFAFALLYLCLVARIRGRISRVECIAAGCGAAFLLIQSFFFAVALFNFGPVPYMVFFPGFLLRAGDYLLLSGALLGLIVAPAGALSGWIFWRIGVAPAKAADHSPSR